jgi:hypothetical protein
MVRRALEGDIQGDLEVILKGLGGESPEIIECPQRRVDRGMPPRLGTNAPWTPRVIRAGNGSVVPTFAVRAADGMDGRQIQDIEPQGRHIRQTRLAVFKRAVTSRFRGTGAWKHLIPGAEAGAFAIDDHPQLLAIGRRQGAVGMRAHHGG